MLALGPAFGAGFSLWGTLTILGLIVRYQPHLQGGGSLELFASPWILVPAAVLFAAELIAGKVPRWDVRWHLRQGWVRVAGAAGIAFLAAGPLPLDVRLMVALLGAAAALAVHLARAGIHVGAHAAGTASFAVPLAGVVEDLLMGALLLPLSVRRPELTLMMIGVVSIALTLALFLNWSSTREIFWDMLLGAREEPANDVRK